MAINSYSCFAFILTRAIGTSPAQAKSALSRLPICRSDYGESGLRTKDRVYDLTVRATRAALLDLVVVDLEEVVEPGKQLRARFSHDEDA